MALLLVAGAVVLRRIVFTNVAPADVLSLLLPGQVYEAVERLAADLGVNIGSPGSFR